jgi:hypothetical protein
MNKPKESTLSLVITLLFGIAAISFALLAGYEKYIVPNPNAAWHMALAAGNCAIFFGRSHEVN